MGAGNIRGRDGRQGEADGSTRSRRSCLAYGLWHGRPHFDVSERSGRRAAADRRRPSRRRLGNRRLCERLRQPHVAHSLSPSRDERPRPVRRPVRRDARSPHADQLLRIAVKPPQEPQARAALDPAWRIERGVPCLTPGGVRPGPSIFFHFLPKTSISFRAGFKKFQFYPVYPTTRNSLGFMTRKLSVTALRNSRHRLGTSWRRKPSVASAKSL